MLVGRMRHQFNGRCPGQLENTIQGFQLQRPRKRKEEIRQPMTRGQPLIHPVPIGSIQPALLVGLKRETPADQFPGRKDSVQQHVRAKMLVLMSINVRWPPAIKTLELLGLRLIHVPESLAQSWVIKKERV